MSGLTIQIRAEDGLLQPLQRMLARLADKSPLMAILADYLAASTRDRFETQTGPDGKRWKPSIRAQLSGGQTLVDSGTLRDRIVAAHGADFAQAGTNDIRAPIHQFGGVIRPRNGQALRFSLPGAGGFRTVRQVVMPARPFFGIDADDRGQLLGLTADYIAEAAP